MKVDSESIVYIALDTLTAILAVIGNSLVCVVVLKSVKLRRKPMYMFVTSLAFADITVGAIAIPFGIFTKLGYPHNNPVLCIVMLSFIIIPTQISIFNLMTVSIERYLAIRHPHLHYAKLNRKKSFLIIIVTWAVSIFIGCISLFWNNRSPLQSPAVLEEGHSPHSNHTNPSTSISNSTKHLKVDCHFMAVIHEDYMFFNFVACVLLPLLVCGVLYFNIFLSFFNDSPLLHYNAPLKPNSSKDFGRSNSNSLPSSEGNESNASDIIYQNPLSKICGKFQKEAEKENEKADSTDASSSQKSLTNRTDQTHTTDISLTNKSDSDVKVTVNKQCQQSHFPMLLQQTKNEFPNTNNTQQQHNQIERYRRRRREMKAAAVLGIIVLTFAICWMPIHILNTIHKFRHGQAMSGPSWLFSAAILLSHANSAVNVFLYSWRLKAFRQALNRKVLNKLP